MKALHECCDIERRRVIVRRQLVASRVGLAVQLLAGTCFVIGWSMLGLVVCGIVGGSSPAGTMVTSAIGLFSGHLLWRGLIIAAMCCTTGVSLSWIGAIFLGDG